MEKVEITLSAWISGLAYGLDGDIILLRDLYIMYIRDGGVPCTDRQFASAMRGKGFESIHTRRGTAFRAKRKGDDYGK